MIDAKQLRDLINDVLEGMGSASPAAVNLLLGTAAQESTLGTFIKQIGHGPALGIMQMEPATEADIWDNYLAFRPDLRAKIASVCARHGPGPWLKYDMAYQIAMARIHYMRVRAPLPPAGDVHGLGKYWKQYYNTPLGAGHIEEFVENYQLTRA